MTAPRVRTIESQRNSGYYRYKDHDISIDRSNGNDEWWYIRVMHPSGSYVYDGWWRDSAGKTKREAIIQACDGAGLHTKPSEGQPT